MKKILVLLVAMVFALTLGTFVREGMAWTGDKMIADSIINYLDPSNAGFDARFDVEASGSAAGGMVLEKDTLLTDIGGSHSDAYNGPVKGVVTPFAANALE